MDVTLAGLTNRQRIIWNRRRGAVLRTQHLQALATPSHLDAVRAQCTALQELPLQTMS
jgi:hypothetical protein